MTPHSHSFTHHHHAWWRQVRGRLAFVVTVCIMSLCVVCDIPVDHHTLLTYTHAWDQRDREHYEMLREAEQLNLSPRRNKSFIYILRRSEDPSRVFKALLSDTSSDAGVAYGLWGLAWVDPDYFRQVAPTYAAHETRLNVYIRHGTYCVVETYALSEVIDDFARMPQYR